MPPNCTPKKRTLRTIASAILLAQTLAANAGADIPAVQLAAASPGSPSILASNDINALYTTATNALSANKPVEAREILERIVAERPEFAGAWLDLALAAYRSGDVEAGLEHLDYLRSHFALPPVLANQVDYWYKLWQNPSDQPVKSNKWQGELMLGFGHDTNVNAGLANDNLSITFAGNTVLFPVDRASRPYADSFALLGLSSWGPAQSLGKGSVTPVFLMRGKRMGAQNDYDSLDLQAGAVYLQPSAGSGSWRLAGFIQQNQLGDSTLNNAIRLNAQRIYPWSSCQIAVGGEIEKRKAREDAEIGGNLATLTGGLSCPLPADASFSTQLRLGHTRPRAGWPGGSKTGQELALQYTRPIGGGLHLDLTWRTARLNDAEGYSPLLENNAPRRLTRQSLTIALRQPIKAGWDALVTLESLWQRSNLEIFRYNSHVFTVALTKQF